VPISVDISKKKA